MTIGRQPERRFCTLSCCVASLGLDNTVRADILEGDVWGALKSQKYKRRNDSLPSCVASLGLGNIVRADILEGDV